MNITIAIDSLKGSLSSLEAGHAIEEGIRRVYKDAAVNVRPLADGGEGTVEALACGMGGTLETVTVTGPMGRPVDCQYGILPESGTAIIEMSGAAGITLVPDAEKDPMKATTFGVGQVIRSAIQKGCRRFIVGIGGSATNDGGTGMLQALGYGILDRDGNQIPPGAQGLAQIASISSEHVLPELSECTFRIACDVNNPLCGPRGASAVYGPQKGADEAMVQVMDRGLAHFAEIAGKWNPKADPEFPGTSRRRTGLCLFNLHQRSPGIRDPDRSGGNEAAGVCEGCRPGDHRRGPSGRADCHGKGPCGSGPDRQRIP